MQLSKVWIFSHKASWEENYTTLGIFSTKEKAKEFEEKQLAYYSRMRAHYDYTIEEWYIDAQL